MRHRPAKRAVDVVIAASILIAASPIIALAALAIWLQDFHSPIYASWRTGRDAKPFRMFKLRSMVVDAERTGVSSTATGDTRITPIGRTVRAIKLDELPQLWNVLAGDMSLVGPRPNVTSETDAYTEIEKRLLDVRPGITDFASIVFADEGDILSGAEDPDLAYNQLIRPGKSRLGLFYVDNMGLLVDLQLLALTALAIFSKKRARLYTAGVLHRLRATNDLVELAKRVRPLEPAPPPGATEIVSVILPKPN